MLDDCDMLQVNVIDNGCGIRDGDKDNLFKLFGTVDTSQQRVNLKGIGLGLVISKTLVHKFGGSISYTSTWGEGSDFQFSFQLSKFDPSLKPKVEEESEDEASDSESVSER